MVLPVGASAAGGAIVTPRAAVVIVTYNSASCIGDCLRALEGQAEVWVVDNASADETCRSVRAAAPRVGLIRNRSNRGFAAAVNQGIQASRAPLVLLMNPDVRLQSSLDPLIKECGRPGVAAAAGRLRAGDGAGQKGFNIRNFPTAGTLACEVLMLNRLWPSNPLNRRYRQLDFDPERSQDVEQPAGALLMVRREVLEEIGGLDERFYPLWFEDVDLCLRIRRAGYRIRYVPECVAQHGGAHSLASMTLEERFLAWYGNLLRFGCKHYSKRTSRWLRAMVSTGLACRWLACFAGLGTAQERAVYGVVFRRLDDDFLLRGQEAELGTGTLSRPGTT